MWSVMWSVKKWKALVFIAVIIVAGLGVAASFVVPGELDKRHRSQVLGEVTIAVKNQAQDGVIQSVQEVDKVYLVGWKGSETPHLSLYVGGLLIEIQLTGPAKAAVQE
ncbi:hypothetical protein LCGC14_0721200 [marine sediment metagenome]|uniref:Uncharacterized protein n=1 Tax=marine sediment metagenome TaxID=412755 RepID=A0A0F9QCC8_9ZZZZ